MNTTQFHSPNSDPLVISSDFRRVALEFVEKMCRPLKRKPRWLYDIRDQKTTPFLITVSAWFRSRVAEGVDRDVLLDAHEVLRQDTEAAIHGDPSSIPGRLYRTAAESYQAEVEGECHANALQAAAAQPGASLDLKRQARDATARELRTLRQYYADQCREISNLEALQKHVGPYRRPIGAA